MSKGKLLSLAELKANVEDLLSIRLVNSEYRKTWDEVYLTDCGEKHPNGTIHSVMKLYNLDDNSIRISFCYHIDGCFHTEYLENQPDICDVSELVEMANKIYVDKVQHIKFVPQPDWIN